MWFNRVSEDRLIENEFKSMGGVRCFSCGQEPTVIVRVLS